MESLVSQGRRRLNESTNLEAWSRFDELVLQVLYEKCKVERMLSWIWKCPIYGSYDVWSNQNMLEKRL